MNKYRNIICLILIFYLISIQVEYMVGDILKLKSAEINQYTICEVEINDIGYISGPTDKWAYFNFENRKEKVSCNFWEQKGDVIEVAYDAKYNFIRTGLRWDETSIPLWCGIIIGLIAIVYDLKNGGKGENKINRLLGKNF